MRDKDLANFMTDGVQPKTHALDRFVRKFVNTLVNSFVVPWLASCLAKYSEYDFHARMQDPQFDFIADWKTNHPDKYPAFIRKAQKLKHNIDFNENEITDRIVRILNEQGWTVYAFERDKLLSTVVRVKGEIYGFKPY
jgi:hypothetical protein